jgi:hypothetical protein
MQRYVQSGSCRAAGAALHAPSPQLHQGLLARAGRAKPLLQHRALRQHPAVWDEGDESKGDDSDSNRGANHVRLMWLHQWRGWARSDHKVNSRSRWSMRGGQPRLGTRPAGAAGGSPAGDGGVELVERQNVVHLAVWLNSDR